MRAVSSFERQWNYDASYLREMIGEPSRGMAVFAGREAGELPP